MHRPTAGLLAGVLAGAVVPVVLCAALGPAAVAALPSGPVSQAVLSYEGSADPAVHVDGIRVVGTMPTLHMAVVRGQGAALTRLEHLAGVRGLAPDDAVQVASKGYDSVSGGVLASDGLGGAAGTSSAGRGVRVALVDTGVSDTPALSRASGRLLDAVDTSSGSPVTSGTFDDGYGHGTFMASVLAGGPVDGTDGQALGVAPGATVLVVKVAGDDGTTSLSRVLEGLDWVAAHSSQVDIANLSLSHDRPGDAYGADPLTDAVEQIRSEGVTVVVAAGNDRSTLGDPGFDPSVLTVGAADVTRGRVARFSGSGTVDGVLKPDVVANGVDVLGLLPPDSVLAQEPTTRHLAHGLFRGSGTSQATAVTSGLAAIFLAANPGSTPAQVKAALRCAAVDLHGRRDGRGLAQTTTTQCAGSDGQALDGSGDATGEVSFDASSWAASSWAASSWAASSWAASSWAASSWAASSWAASSWAAADWGSDADGSTSDGSTSDGSTSDGSDGWAGAGS